MRPKSRTNFTIAIICALPLEAEAVEALFDEHYDRLGKYYGKKPGDLNAYINGRIGKHNVVLCYMPGIGKVSTAAVTSSLQASYPGIMLALATGICGGAPLLPEYREIFLGDVIISDLVIEYDFGRQYPDSFQRKTKAKDTLGRPFQEIQALLKGLRAENTFSKLQNQAQHYLYSLQETGTKWCHPGVNDILFRASYLHKHYNYSSPAGCSCFGSDLPEQICEEAFQKDCDDIGCDQGEQIRCRKVSKDIQTSIHIGPIASSDTIIKFGQHREEIVRKEKVIGFDVEGAWIWDNVPCIIIKGVCDYADSHKSMLWQAYAAATGASVTKAFLDYWMPANHQEPSNHRLLIPFARNPHFVGRQEEIQRLENLISVPDRAKNLAITGLGGIGKTQIALELAYRMRDREPDCSIFWISCTSYEAVEQAFMTIAQMVGLQGVEPTEVKECLRTYFNQTNKKWFLVFDNADDMDMWIQGSPTALPLMDIIPRSGNGHVLFTSRNRKLAVRLASPNVLSVPDVDQQTAKEIFKQQLIWDNLFQDDHVIITLLEQLAFLPLAISQSTAFINQNRVALDTYMSLLDEGEKSTIELLSEDFRDNGRYAEIQNPVATTWLISFLQIQQVDKLAIDYLSFMACISPRDIPESILPPTLSAKRMVEALGLLKSYSFISAQVNNSILSLHRLVHLATRNWLRNEDTLKSWVKTAAGQLNKIFPSNYHSNRQMWRDYLPHALYLVDSEEFQDYQDEYGDFLERVGSCLKSDGRYLESETLFRNVLEIRERVCGPDHPDTLTSVSHLGFVLADQGKYKEAEAMHQRALQGRENIFGPDNPDTLSSISHISFVLAQQGKYQEAEAMQLKALDDYKKILGPDHPDTLSSVSYLGLVLADQGKHEAAEAMHRQALQGREKILGPDHPDTLSTVSHLGSVLARQGKHEAAEAMHRQALQGREEILGPNHPDTLSTVGYLDSVLARQGKCQETKAVYRQDLAESEKGGRNSDTLQATSSQGHQEVVQLLREENAKLEEGQIDDDSDIFSDVSDVNSVFSSSSSLESFASAGSYEDARLTAAQHLTYILSEDPLLQQLYLQAMQKLGKDRFAKNHDRLLKRFLADVRIEGSNAVTVQTVRFLQPRSQREQVTAKICQIFQSNTNLADPSVRQQLREQKEDREYLLEVFLKARSEEAKYKDEEERVDKVGAGEEEDGEDEKDETDEEDEEEEEDEDDEEDEEIGENEQDEEQAGAREIGDETRRFQHLDSVVASLSKGTSFEAFRSNLNHLINPPTTIKEALERGDIKTLRQFLRKRFDFVAQGDYSWMRELDNLGYTTDDIADLLFEQANDAPWIYFEPDTFDQVELHAGIHLPGCVHLGLSLNQNPQDPSPIPLSHSFLSADWCDISRTIQELCGLAGITPSRDSEKWIGSVQFEEQNSIGLVSFSQLTGNNDLEDHEIVSRISKALQCFCTAAGYVQAAGLCCDSFTVIRKPIYSFGHQYQTESLVEMCRIDFKLALQLREELESLLNLPKLSPTNTINVHRATLQILRPFSPEATETYQRNDTAAVLHSCSLAVQLLCLGFLSYSQAHVGAIHPFFLDTPLTKIHLLGSHMPVDRYDRIEASLSNLTCIGDMIRAPVLIFNLCQSQTVAQSVVKPQAYDLLTNAEDILDTWGPGHLVVPDEKDKPPCAIRLGDGIVWSSDPDSQKFHWSRSVTQEDLSRGVLNPRSKIVIGALITVNESCKVNQEDCWASSCTSLEPLGPYGTCWELDETQYGLQAGNYVLLQANRTWHKRPGLTLKQYRLQQDDEMLIPFLGNLWGVQVSFCTHIARRVPLYELVTDMLPVFATVVTTSQDEERLWDELNTTHHIVDAFRRNGVRNWLSNLSPELYQLVMKIIRRIFDVLQHTGLDREGNHLLVAWPDKRDIFRCFKVPCQKQSSWARVLADSEDCATFAYISTKCFETEKIKCSGPGASWRNAILLLETAVVIHSKSALTPTSTLQHKSTYFFRKFDNPFFVAVQRPNIAGTAILTTLSSNFPGNIKQRVLEKFMGKEKEQRWLSRLRERIAPDDLAEQVVVTITESF